MESFIILVLIRNLSVASVTIAIAAIKASHVTFAMEGLNCSAIHLVQFDSYNKYPQVCWKKLATHAEVVW